MDPKYSLLNRGRRSVAFDLKKPEAIEAVFKLVEKADALIEGSLSRRDRAPRPGPRRLSQAQPAPHLRAHDGMGPGGSARARRRPRHQLHRAVGRAAQHRAQGRRSRSAAESRRRLPRRRALPGSGSGRGPARGAEVGQGPGRRRRDGRRRRVVDDRDLRHARLGLRERRARRQHPRHRRSLLRSLRNQGRQARRDRIDRGKVLRRVAACCRAYRARNCRISRIASRGPK